jgi:peptidoglycan/xylan/chitin deacetylase (PgdA/CDA1 family)
MAVLESKVADSILPSRGGVTKPLNGGPLKKIILSAFLLFAAFSAGAQSTLPLPQVLAWNGHKAAASLTFDDSDPSQLAVAVPEMNRRGLHGTFFLIANRTDEKDQWRQAFKAGHELGNHSLDHLHPATLNPGQEQSQVAGAQVVLQNAFGIPIYSYAYPYTEITPGILKWVQQNCFIARGGYGDYYMKPDSEPDWFNIPSQTTMTATPVTTYQQWIARDFDSGAWMVFMIHGLEGTPWGYEPIKTAVFNQILDALQAKDIWVETFSTVGAYWKAQKVFEKTVPVQGAGQIQWTWTVPDHFPSQVVLRMKLSGASLFQAGKQLMPDSKGFYSVSFDQKELIEKSSASN